MPIYEFYCPECNTIYSFLSRTVTTSRTPCCPTCKKESLQRQVSLFSAVTKSRGKGEGEGDDPLDNLPIDETKMMGAMESLASEAEGMSEDDPRQAARLMRKLSDMTGLKYQDNIEEALSRMEAGEDPEAIEASMGDMLEGDEMPFVMDGKKGRMGGKIPPRRDEKLYEM